MKEKPQDREPDDRAVDLDSESLEPTLTWAGSSFDETSSLPPELGHYRIEGELGRGGMGVVYLANDTRLQRQVALKVMPDRLARDGEALERFQREARLLAAINHPNIATIHSLEDVDGVRFLTMELIAGVDLRRRLADGRLSIDESLSVSRQIAAALQAAHQKGIVHRDLKPMNVMIAAEDRAKVLDFGLATALAGGSRMGVPDEGELEVCGTPGYMSPEQIRGERVDARADIWAFGCILFECLSGRTPFGGSTVRDRVVATLTREPEWTSIPDATPPALRSLIESCLQKDSQERPKDVASIRRQIEEIVASRAMPVLSPAPEATGAHPNNLPSQLGTFIGRAKQRREVGELLRQHRLVTLTGFGGTGKTRLSLEIARDLLSESSGGAWYVELAPLTRPDLVPQAVLAALGLRPDPNQAPIRSLVEACRHRSLLLVLDNCEHLLAASAELTKTLLEAAPALRVLATSREALGLSGEVLYSVPPLSLPSVDAARGVEDLGEVEAIQLFVDRARNVKLEFALTAENSGAVIDICRRLDGIALAIELAAARIKVLPPAAIAEKLEHRFRLLRGDDRTALPHHQTLRAMVDWSYDQLDEGERAVLRRLSVFAGGWTLDAAEAVCAGESVEEWEALDHLFRLVGRSWIETDAEGTRKSGQTRYRMLETVREYARERLLEAAEEESTKRRHRDWYLALAESGVDAHQGAGLTTWFARLQIEHDNLRSALETSLREQGDELPGVRLAVALSGFWLAHGHYREGLQWLQAFLSTETAEEPGRSRALALHHAGNFAFSLSDYDAARVHYEEAASAFERMGERRRMMWSLGNIGTIAQYQGDYDRAREVFTQTLDVAREFGNGRDEVTSLICLGAVERDAGNLEESLPLLEEAVRHTRDLGDQTLEAYALGNLAVALSRAGRIAQSKQPNERALEIFRELGDEDRQVNELVNLGMLQVGLGDLDAAKACLREAVSLQRRFGKTRNVGTALASLAGLARARGDPERAAYLMGASRSITESLGLALSAIMLEQYERTIQDLRSRLGDATFEAAWERGRSADWEAALECGLL